MKQFEAELLKDDWTRVSPEVEGKQIAIPQAEGTYILCGTAGRKEKEGAIRKRFSTRMELALQRLQKTIATGRLKDRNKMERRLGKIPARHSQVIDLFEVALRDTAEGVRLFWEIKKERQRWRDLREGAYLLRTNLPGESAQELWSKYMQLTEAEASFRALKSELSIRSAFVPSKGTAGQGSRDGGVSGLRPLGHSETFTETAACDDSPAIGQRRKQCRAVLSDEGIGPVVHAAERRYRIAHH